MASTSSAASSPHKYDVFLSFRGEDTRFSFTNNLYHALIHAGIRTFRDDDEIGGGQELKPELERSIMESKASIIVFSENFANSRWCLDELCLILQQRRNAGHFVLPVFYKVDPSVVRKQQGSFAITAKEDLKWAENNVKRWKEALTEVADLKGMVLSGSRYEKDFIADIVDQVRQKLGLDIYSPATSLTGIETRAKRVISWLRSDQPDHPVLAICGMGGSGKTTLAKHIYYSNKQNFEGCCLVEGIEQQPDSLLGVQNKLLRDISGSNSMMISNVDEGAVRLERVIRMRKVLIVVDDIDDKDKLSSLFGTNAFHTQSKIIITTRILNIDTWFESVSFRCHVYQLELLNLGESIELLCWHAFGSKVPKEGFENLAEQLAQYCGGNPLALKVLGSSLPVSIEKPRNNMLEIWRGRMNALNSFKGDIENKIRGVLERSFESLPCQSHKELFLHIGCFFIKDYKMPVEKVLEDDYQASYGIMTLINRCLVTVSSDGILNMHQLLLDMARNIVYEESKDPAKRSRIWHHDEAYRLLSKGDGSDTIEGLRLNMQKVKQEMTSQTFKTSSLVKMKNLKLLILHSVKLTGSFENLPDLRLLDWHKSNIKTIPPGLLKSSLVAIHLTCGDLEKFEPPTDLYSVKILNLSWSHKLVSICNLHRLPKLDTLYLSYCTSLTHVCETIGDLENLSYLELEGCTKLWKDSSNQKFVNQPKRMKASLICGGIPEQPLVSLPQSLLQLTLSNSLFKILPNHIDLKVLRSLYLNFCSNLMSVPCLPSTLKELHVNWCMSLERITFQTARFTLQKFTYEGCNKLCEIEGLFKLVSVSKLEEADLEPVQWIKAYQNHNVDLIGDVITKYRTFDIQMLYEYGIRSTYLQGIEDHQSMMTNYEYMSSSKRLSFCVPMHPKKNRIQGLNVTILYISSGGDDSKMSLLFTKISNRTKGLSWVYNPVVFCKPRSEETDVVWLSYWPIGNILDVGDEVHVTILADKYFTVRECGASIVYMDDGDEVEKEEKSEQMKAVEEVIGGDLSSFQVSEGAYYLCRCNLFKSTPDGLKWLFGDNIESTSTTDTKGWRMSRGSGAYTGNPKLISFQNTSRWNIQVEYSIKNFDGESETKMIEKAVSSVEGVESVIIHKDIGRLFVCGCFNPQAVIKCVIQFMKMVDIIYIHFF